MRRLNLLLAFMVALLAGCDVASKETNPPWKVEKKYYLRDCIVKVDFAWAADKTYAEKSEIMGKITAQMTRTMVSGVFPTFSGHHTRDLGYHVFYFADKCEQKKEMTQRLIDKFFVPNVPGFPPYKIIDQGIEPGFDGVMPSGMWLDR